MVNIKIKLNQNLNFLLIKFKKVLKTCAPKSTKSLNFVSGMLKSISGNSVFSSKLCSTFEIDPRPFPLTKSRSCFNSNLSK